jgi:secretion/DNA translocation related CpaE-like protein
MTSHWVLLLTDDPLTATTTARLAGSLGLPVRSDADPVIGPVNELSDDPVSAVGSGPPGLILVGADRLAQPLPSAAAGVPRVLVATGEPEDRFWRAALQLRAEQVVLLPEAEQILLDRLTRLADRPDRRALVIAVTGGCGGAGASVLAGALARSAVRVARSLLIEVDRMGSGADLLLGAEDEPGLRWPDLASARGRLLPGSLLGAVPVVDGLHVLSWDRSPHSIDLSEAAGTAVLDTAVQEFGIVVLDLPRCLDAVAVVAARTADLALLVVPAEVRAAAAARRVAAGLQEHLADVRVVVRGPAPTGLRAEAVADALDLPLAGVLKPEPGLREALDRGEPPGLRVRGPLSMLCRQLLTCELSELVPERGSA